MDRQSVNWTVTDEFSTDFGFETGYRLLLIRTIICALLEQGTTNFWLSKSGIFFGASGVRIIRPPCNFGQISDSAPKKLKKSPEKAIFDL